MLAPPRVGLEPTTLRLTAECSAIELPRNTKDTLAYVFPNVKRMQAICAGNLVKPCVFLHRGKLWPCCAIWRIEPRSFHSRWASYFVTKPPPTTHILLLSRKLTVLISKGGVTLEREEQVMEDQELQVGPDAEVQPQQVCGPNTTPYVVRQGDTFFTIARQFG